MDSNNPLTNGNGAPAAVEPQPDPARVSPAGVPPTPVGGAPTTPTPSIPGGPYTGYQPTPQPYGQPMPAYQAPAAPAQVPATRGRNGALWTVLILLGLLALAAVVLSVLAILSVVGIIGRIDRAQVGPLVTESNSVPLGTATNANAQLNMRAGDLTIMGGGTDLLNADFEYNVAEWKPELSYSVNGNTGALSIKQPESGIITTGNAVNKWNLHFNNDVPITINANTGAGNTTMQIGGLNLKSAEIVSGAGNATLDLTGARKQDTSIRLINSVGNTVVSVPNDVGVKINVVRGLGQLTANGLTANGDTYTNAAYGSGPTINVYVESSVGNITLQTR